MSGTSQVLARGPVRALVHAWLILDFFGDSRRSGQPGSTLTTTIFGQSFMALLFAALLFPDTPAVAFVAANLSLSTLLVCLGYLGDDRSVRRARADRVLVAPAPLRRWQLVAARAGHGAFHLLLLTIGSAIPAAVLLAFLPGQGAWSTAFYLVAACTCSALLAGTVATMLRAAARFAGAPRAQLLGGTLKALLLGGGLIAFALCTRHLDGTAAELPVPRLLVELWPPYWAARLLTPQAAAYGLRLLAAGSVVVALALLFARDSGRPAGTRVARSRLLSPLLAHLAGSDRPVHGVAAFTAANLYRSAEFRSKVLPLFGLPAAMWMLAYFGDDPRSSDRLLAVAVQLPGVYLPFLVAFLGVSDTPRARWLFTAAPHLAASRRRRAVLLALTTHVLLPVHAVLLAVALATLPPLRALGQSALALALAVGVGAWVLRHYDDVPFSASDDQQPLDFGGLLTTALGLTLAGLAFERIAASWAGMATAAVALAIAYRGLRGRPA